MPTPSDPALKPKIAISACLMGAEVRYNGGHKQSLLCRHSLSEHFDFIPICPEVAIGLGTPREPIRLVGDPQQPRAVGTVHAEHDVSQALADYGTRMAGELTDICGYILHLHAEITLLRTGTGQGLSGPWTPRRTCRTWSVRRRLLLFAT